MIPSPSRAGRPVRLLPALCLLALAPGLFSQELPNLVVDGRPLVAARPPVQTGNALLVPLNPIARGLGMTVTLASDQILRVRRPDGANILYEVRTGQVRNGAVLLGTVQQWAMVQLTPDPDQILFPLSGLIPLLGASIREDRDRNTIYIDPPTPGASTDVQAPTFAVGELDYAYGFTTNLQAYGQYANLKGEALLGTAGLSGFLYTTRVPQQGFLVLNQVQVRADLGPDRAATLGDQAVYTGVESLTNALRGLSYERPFRGYKAFVYAGRGVGGISATFGSGGLAQYDTNLVGWTLRKEDGPNVRSFGWNAFSGPQRRGTTFGAAISRRSKWNQLNLQSAAGYFNGLSARTVLVRTTEFLPLGLAGRPDLEGLETVFYEPDGRAVLLRPVSTFVRVQGPAFGVGASDSFTPWRQLTISGQYEYYSKNFITVREDTRFNSSANRVVSVALRPFSLLSLNGGVSEREFLVGDGRNQRNYSFGWNFSMPRAFPLQLGYFRTLQFDQASPFGRFALTQYSVLIPQFRHTNVSMFYSETKLGTELVRSVNATIGYQTGRKGRIGVHYNTQMRTHHRYGGEWSYNFGRRESFLRFGVEGINLRTGARGVLPVAGFRLPLPRGHSMQFSYIRDVGTNFMQIELAGPLSRRQEITRDALGIQRVVVKATLAGRVYLDGNADGQFTPNRDRGLREITVWLDDRVFVETDGNGYYRFDGVDPGAHTLRADLKGVPAGMNFADSGERALAVMPYRENRQDFSVLRTGQIQGRVVMLDGPDLETAKEQGFPDARIIASRNFDTFSEINGAFLLGDLPAGQYQLKVDPETIPEGYVASPSLLTVTVKPDETARIEAFKLVIPPRPIEERRAPSQRIEAAPAAARPVPAPRRPPTVAPAATAPAPAQAAPAAAPRRADENPQAARPRPKAAPAASKPAAPTQKTASTPQRTAAAKPSAAKPAPKRTSSVKPPAAPATRRTASAAPAPGSGATGGGL